MIRRNEGGQENKKIKTTSIPLCKWGGFTIMLYATCMLALSVDSENDLDYHCHQDENTENEQQHKITDRLETIFT